MGRPTGELVVIIVVSTVAVVIVALVVGLLAIELAHPSTDTSAGLRSVWELVAFVVGMGAGVLFRHLIDRNGKD